MAERRRDPERTWVHVALKLGVVGGLGGALLMLMLDLPLLALAGFLGFIGSGIGWTFAEPFALRRLRRRALSEAGPALVAQQYQRRGRRWQRADPPSTVRWDAFRAADPGRVSLSTLLHTDGTLPFRVRIEQPVPVDPAVQITPRGERDAVVRTGDGAFDRAFRVEGPEAAGRALLDARTRRAMRAIPGTVEVNGGRLTARVDADARLPETLEQVDVLAAHLRDVGPQPVSERLVTIALDAAGRQFELQQLLPLVADTTDARLRAALDAASVEWPWIAVGRQAVAGDADDVADALERALATDRFGTPWAVLQGALEHLLENELAPAHAPLVERLASLDAVAARVLARLVRHRQPAVDAIVRRRLLRPGALRAFCTEHRHSDVIDIVSAEPDPRLEAVLIDLLDHHDEDVATRAMQALGRVGGERTAMALSHMGRVDHRAYAFRDAHKSAQRTIARRLGRVQAERFTEVGGGLTLTVPEDAHGGLSPAADGRLSVPTADAVAPEDPVG